MLLSSGELSCLTLYSELINMVEEIFDPREDNHAQCFSQDTGSLGRQLRLNTELIPCKRLNFTITWFGLKRVATMPVVE